MSTSTNGSSTDAAPPPDAPQSTPESPGDAPVEEDAVVDVEEEDTAVPGDDPVPAVAEEPDVSVALN